MKTSLYLVGLCIILSGCLNRKPVQNTIWVFDKEEVLSDNEEATLNEIITRFERETTNEIVIVTTPDIGEHEKMVSYAVEFGDSLGVGKRNKNNGLVIVFSSTLRETFIATGLGIEDILTDSICQMIVDEDMVPNFKDGNYYEGIEGGLNECIRIWKENE